jgi:hypothetical protein
MMTPSPSPLQTVRLQQKQRLKRLMLELLVGSGVLHGLAIALVYLKPTTVKVVPPPEIEIVLEERDPAKESDKTAPSEITTTSGSSGGDETLQVATLNPSAPVSAAESEVIPLNEPEALSDQDLVNLDLNVPIVPKKKPTADQNKSSPDGKGNKDDKGNNSNGSALRGLAPSTGKGAGTGNQTNGNGGDGPKGSGKTKDGGPSKVTTKASPKPIPQPSTTPKPAEMPVAIVPKPKPPETPPKKETPKAPAQNFSYQDKEGERLATGSIGSFVTEYDEKGRLIIKPQGSVGDKELDAAQLRSLNRALEDDPELRQQIEANRGKTFKFKFEGEGETEAEREQIRRNQEIMKQPPAPEAPAATATEPAPTGIGIPIEAPPIPSPDPQPETPAAPPTYEAPIPEAPAAAIEPASEPPVVAPEAPPAYEEPVAPPEPIPEEPIELPAETIAEPPAEATPAQPPPAQPPPAETAPAETAPAETAP